MSRCCMCDYCPTTTSMSGEVEHEGFRNMVYDYASEEHYCDKCVEQWSIAIAEYPEVIPKEDKDEPHN